MSNGKQFWTILNVINKVKKCPPFLELSGLDVFKRNDSVGAMVLKGVSIAGHAILAVGSICTRSCGGESVILRGQPAEIQERNVDWSR